jgi:hypothetical protein
LRVINTRATIENTTFNTSKNVLPSSSMDCSLSFPDYLISLERVEATLSNTSIFGSQDGLVIIEDSEISLSDIVFGLIDNTIFYPSYPAFRRNVYISGVESSLRYSGNIWENYFFYPSSSDVLLLINGVEISAPYKVILEDINVEERAGVYCWL